jgi:hypothetical protein
MLKKLNIKLSILQGAAFWLPSVATPEICTTKRTTKICAKSTYVSDTCLQKLM